MGRRLSSPTTHPDPARFGSQLFEQIWVMFPTLSPSNLRVEGGCHNENNKFS